MKIATFDIGGTALKMAIATSDGTLLAKKKIAINDSNGDQILKEILIWVRAHEDCNGIAISAPGYVDPHSGFIAMGGAIRKFDNFDMKNWLQDKTGLPTAIENDANCVLLSERWKGKASEMADFLILTIGTGIGGAIFCNNRLVHGARCRAGEFGYMQTTRPGTHNLLFSSMNENSTIRVLRLRYASHTGKSFDDITGEEIFDGYDSGDLICRRLVNEFFDGIGTGLYNLFNIFDPQAILIGGGIVERPGFLELLQQHMSWFGIEKYLDVVSHGNDAGLIGAVSNFNQRLN